MGLLATLPPHPVLGTALLSLPHSTPQSTPRKENLQEKEPKMFSLPKSAAAVFPEPVRKLMAMPPEN